MKTLNNREKVLRWASQKRERNVVHMILELSVIDMKGLKKLLNSLKRNGLINYEMKGRSVKLNLTREAYYGRGVLVA